jgi:hypothetical protein
MAKKTLFKSKTNFTLKRLHQSGSYGNIYERDYTTVFKSPSDSSQISVYTSPSFKLTVSAGLNGKKKYKYGNWIANPNSCSNSTNNWTLGCLPNSNDKDSKIILKPNTRRLTDFVCYSSSHDLIKSTLSNIVANYPAEIYITNQNLSSTGIFELDEALKDTPMYKKCENMFIVENPYKIDLLQKIIPDGSRVSSLRYFCESWDKYVILDSNEKIISNADDFKKWNESHDTNTFSFFETILEPDKDCIKDGDLLATVKFNTLTTKDNITTATNVLTLICVYYQNNIWYLSNQKNYRIRPANNIVNDFFDNLNDFGKVLLNQCTDYTAIFETYEETKNNGWIMYEKKYKWPLDKGGWNLAISGIPYSNYLNDLTNMAVGYDMLFTNSIWRDMVHESISNMDLTTISNGEEENIDSSKIKQMLTIVGRQFDDIKKYIDGIKSVNNVSYTQENNIPDYFLSDTLDMSGWESKEILNEISNDLITEPMYGSRTLGYTASDANNEFMRRLQLNSRPILSEKGTKRCIEDLMAIFGYHSTDWLRRYYGKLTSSNDSWDEKLLRKAFMMIEYVYVADGYAFEEDDNTICQEVKYLNSLKDNNKSDESESGEDNDYYGLPVAEATYNDTTRLVPWFNKYNEYDSKLYFQMKGGWARNEGNGTTDPHIYDYTISKIHYLTTMEELYGLLSYTLDKFGVYYVGSNQNYYRLKDEMKSSTEEGWELLSEDEISYVEKIVDNNKGNNPHTGQYDGGAEFYAAFGELFKDSKFDNIREDEIDAKFNYGFNITRQADSTKCLFFDNDVLGHDDSALRGENKIKPVDLFSDNKDESYSEQASLSVINSKELHIIFDNAHQDFLEKDVLPYLKQIIPSTTIFSYSFEKLDGDDDKLYQARTHKVVCDGEICPIYGVV